MHAYVFANWRSTGLEPKIYIYEIILKEKDNKWIAFKYSNFHGHLSKSPYNKGSYINLAANHNLLIVNWQEFNLFKVYLFCPLMYHQNKLRKRSC